MKRSRLTPLSFSILVRIYANDRSKFWFPGSWSTPDVAAHRSSSRTARVPDEPRGNEDDFGAGVEDTSEPWESRAEAFDAPPRRMPTAVIASSTIATRAIQARAMPIWANREPIPIAPPRVPAVTIRACPAPPAAAVVVVAEPEAMATSRPRARRSEARAAVIIRTRGNAAVARASARWVSSSPA